MASVNVSRAVVKQAENLCRTAIAELNNSNKKLGNRFREAGQYWKDSKYKQLGEIINDCSNAMNSPVKELQECIVKLQEMEKAIIAYEETTL